MIVGFFLGIYFVFSLVAFAFGIDCTEAPRLSFRILFPAYYIGLLLYKLHQVYKRYDWPPRRKLCRCNRCGAAHKTFKKIFEETVNES